MFPTKKFPLRVLVFFSPSEKFNIQKMKRKVSRFVLYVFFNLKLKQKVRQVELNRLNDWGQGKFFFKNTSVLSLQKKRCREG